MSHLIDSVSPEPPFMVHMFLNFQYFFPPLANYSEQNTQVYSEFEGLSVRMCCPLVDCLCIASISFCTFFFFFVSNLILGHQCRLHLNLCMTSHHEIEGRAKKLLPCRCVLWRCVHRDGRSCLNDGQRLTGTNRAVTAQRCHARAVSDMTPPSSPHF